MADAKNGGDSSGAAAEATEEAAIEAKGTGKRKARDPATDEDGNSVLANGIRLRQIWTEPLGCARLVPIDFFF